MSLRVADLPDRERPRERLMARGAEALSERELVALLVRHGRRGESSLDLAARLLSDFGGLEELAAARAEDLTRRSGIGNAKAAGLVAAFELARRIGIAPAGVVLRRPADVAAVAMNELRDLRRERLLVLICSGANRLRAIERVSEGSADRALIPVREVLSAVLRHDGRAFAVAHNHPSGDATPSNADRLATEAIQAGAETLGVRFLCHVVVAAGKWREANAHRGLD